MNRGDLKKEVDIARKLLLFIRDAHSLCRSMDLGYEGAVKDRSRHRYHYEVDKMLAGLNKLLVLSPVEVQRFGDKMGSPVLRGFLSDLGTALSRQREPAEFFRAQGFKVEKEIVELRLQALEEAVFGTEEDEW